MPANIRQALTSFLIVLVTVALVACSRVEAPADNGLWTPGAPEVSSSPSATPEAPVDVPSGNGQQPAEVPEELKIIWETWHYLQQDYVNRADLDPSTLAEEAIKGLLEGLGDPHTSYIRPEVLAGDFQDVFYGEFEGIGAHISANENRELVIVAPVAGSPAEVAGIKAGDIILEIDGQSVQELSLLEAVAKIRGPEGTTVRIMVRHEGESEPVEISVKRGVIPLTSVEVLSAAEDPFTHIRISNFYPNTPEQLEEALTETINSGSKGLILDLRYNPGGVLDAAVEVASQFLEEGLVLYDIDGDGVRKDWEVREGGIATEIPMVVLVNQYSASSSEVLAGALQDHERAKVIGSQTFGKGSVNILRPLSNGGGLYITIAHWYTPDGRMIEGTGITPDIEVTSDNVEEAFNLQLSKAIEELERSTATDQPEGAR